MDLSNFSGQSVAHNEFRSDTFTTPTSNMIMSICKATVGDSVYNEDDSTTKLEKKVAEIAGKESGLYCVSGTLSNQIALRTHLFQPPYSILCDDRGHVYRDEAAGLAILSQAMVQPIKPKNGLYLTLDDDIIPNIIPDDGDIHEAPTKLISLENTIHGVVIPIEEIAKISKFSREKGIRIHLDGARLWNASVETGVSIEEYCSYFDSVSLCISKTLGAPIGSVLVSDKLFIRKANHFKKQSGGGIRQAGLLAEMAITAIDENLSKLKATHEMAKDFSAFCTKNNLALDLPVHTNIVFVNFSKSGLDAKLFTKLSKEYGIKTFPGRIVFHYQISEESYEKLKTVFVACLENSKVKSSESEGPKRLYSTSA